MYRSLEATSVTPIYQTGMQIATQPVIPLQPAAHVYSSYTSAIPASPHVNLQSASFSHIPTNHHQTSVHRPVSKTPTLTTIRGSLCPNANENEGRTVYVYNLPYTVSQQAIKEHLAAAGVVDRCLVKEDRQRSSKYKLTAVVTFRTPQQAQTAIDRFNGSVWKGYEVKVKLDRGPTPSGAPGARNGKSSTTSRARDDRRETREGPLVVNGSGPRVANRQAHDDSDDESSCDDGM